MMKTVIGGKYKGMKVKVMGESQTWMDFKRVELPSGKVVNQHKDNLK